MQSEAVKYLEKMNIHRVVQNQPLLALLERECSSRQSRYFLVDDLHTFYQKYIAMNFRHRSFYEVLHPDFPCNLYFDIEYDKN